MCSMQCYDNFNVSLSHWFHITVKVAMVPTLCQVSANPAMPPPTSPDPAGDYGTPTRRALSWKPSCSKTSSARSIHRSNCFRIPHLKSSHRLPSSSLATCSRSVMASWWAGLCRPSLSCSPLDRRERSSLAVILESLETWFQWLWPGMRYLLWGRDVIDVWSALLLLLRWILLEVGIADRLTDWSYLDIMSQCISRTYKKWTQWF